MSNALRFMIRLLILLLITPQLHAQEHSGGGKTISIALPGKQASVKKPASDLQYQGRVIDAIEASRLSEQGVDISNLDPVANKLWQAQAYSVSDAEQMNYPTSEVGVHFIGFEASFKFTSLMRVQSNADSQYRFRLGVSRYSQSMMMRSGLLRLLGYYIPSPSIYKRLKVSFDSLAVKKSFLDQAQLETNSDFTSRGWVSDPEPNKNYLYLNSATLETVSQDYFDLNWGLAPNPDDPAQVALLQRLSRLRAFRSLLMPYSIIDVPESVNRYSVRHTQVQSGYAIIPYFMAHSFTAIAYEDAKWILRRLADLTESDVRAVVALAQYPQALEELVVRKTIVRINQVLSVFGLQSRVADPDLNYTSSDRSVDKGKVTKEFFAGYPQRFSHGERQSPYQDGDLGRYLGIEGISSLIRNATDRLNKRLELMSVQDHARSYQQDQIRRLIDHIRNRPNEPYARKVDQWGGPIGAFNANMGRFIATGTYSGSTAPVQLIDSLTVSAGIGYFHALDGIQKYVPFAGGNLSVSRDYTHVRPIYSITEGSKESWKNLIVPNYMKSLAKVLDGDLNTFLADMRDGEVFSISDSVALSAYIQASSSLDVLFGLAPFDYMNSISLGADANRVVVRQMQFVRIANSGFNGIHVYVREMKNRGQGLELSTDFFINLLKIRAQNSAANIRSDAFVIAYDPQFSREVDPNTPKGKELAQIQSKLKLSILPLFRSNDPELLYANFKYNQFGVEHDLKTHETKLKFLAWRSNSFTEDHLLQVRYPEVEGRPDLNPEDEKIEVFAHKRGELRGRDLLSLGFEFIDGLFRKKNKDIRVSRGFGENPANVPLGRAFWKIVNSETDLSPYEPVGSVASLQHVWGGWSLEHAKFIRILREIQKEFSGTTVFKNKLIDEREFQNVKSLDFYRITAHLSIFEQGIPRIRDLLLQNGRTTDSDRSLVEKFVLSMQKTKPADRKLNDKDLYREMITLLGNGNYQEGLANYERSCLIERMRRPGQRRGLEEKDRYKGNNFDCLTRWMRQLIQLAHDYPAQDKKEQTRWVAKVIEVLDDYIPMPQLLNYLGQENYIFMIRINGFRPGDEDGDLVYFSNTYGQPENDIDTAGGIVNYYIRKTGLMPTELDRTLGGFQ